MATSAGTLYGTEGLIGVASNDTGSSWVAPTTGVANGRPVPHRLGTIQHLTNGKVAVFAFANTAITPLATVTVAPTFTVSLSAAGGSWQAMVVTTTEANSYFWCASLANHVP
jgi:hypothetical protein